MLKLNLANVSWMFSEPFASPIVRVNLTNSIKNRTERRFQTVKGMTNTIIDRSGSSVSTWLLAMMYICFVLNHSYCSSIKDIPIQKLSGSTPNISPLLRFIGGNQFITNLMTLTFQVIVLN